jgi:hypothetical protein
MLGGCGKSVPRLKVYPVHGTVKLKGAPVVMGLVEFKPAIPGKGMPCSGIIEKDGTFAMRTYGGIAPPDGAVPGTYRVSVTSLGEVEGAGAPPKGVTPTKVPMRFTDPETSGVTVEIKSTDYDLTINLGE